MADGMLTLARVICRLTVKPKSIAYHAHREAFAARYFPDFYGDWQLSPTAIRLVDEGTHKRMSLEADAIGFDADDTSNIPALQRHIDSAVQDYVKTVVAKSTPDRFGWRAQFLLEHSSFQELYPHFRSTTLGSVDWWRLEGLEDRDLAHTIFYGKEDDGLNLAIGVLTPAQTKEWVEKSGFKTQATELAITDGALLIDLDRYVTAFKSKNFLRVMNEHERIVRIAETVASKLVRKG